MPAVGIRVPTAKQVVQRSPKDKLGSSPWVQRCFVILFGMC